MALNYVYYQKWPKMAENAENKMEAKKGNFWIFKACKVSIDSPGPKDWDRELQRHGKDFFMREKQEKVNFQYFPL